MVTGSSGSQNFQSAHQQKRHTYKVMEQRNVLPRHQKQKQWIKRTNPLSPTANVYHRRTSQTQKEATYYPKDLKLKATG